MIVHELHSYLNRSSMNVSRIQLNWIYIRIYSDKSFHHLEQKQRWWKLFSQWKHVGIVQIDKDHNISNAHFLAKRITMINSSEIGHEQHHSIFSSKSLSRIAEMFLPQGYPASVHHKYLSFSLWSFVQNIIGSCLGALSTQALLISMGYHSQSVLGSAVTLQWIIKDALGHLGGILTAGWLGKRFDLEAKKLRFISIFSMYIASAIEMSSLMFPGMFLFFASLANVIKNVTWIVNSATRASLLLQFSITKQLGDLTAKSASQNTAAGLIGTGLGILISKVFDFSHFSQFAITYAPLSIIGIYSLYQSVHHMISNMLTQDRMNIILNHLLYVFTSQYSRETLLNTRIDDLFSKSNIIVLPPDRVCSEESFIPIIVSNSKHSKQICLIINASLNPKDINLKKVFSRAQWIRSNILCSWDKKDENTTIYIWILEDATVDDKLFAYFWFYIHKYQLFRLDDSSNSQNTEALFVILKHKLIASGWDINSFHYPLMDCEMLRYRTISI